MEATAKSIFSPTVQASAKVTAHRFVTVQGAHAGAADIVFGVAAYDAAQGEHFAAHRIGSALVTAGNDIPQFAEVTVDVGGMAKTAEVGDTPVGIAMSAGTAGKLLEVMLSL
jgi:hypothetical protein